MHSLSLSLAHNLLNHSSNALAEFAKAAALGPLVQLFELALVEALRVVLVQQFLPVGRFLRLQVADDLARVVPLLFAALFTVAAQRVRQSF